MNDIADFNVLTLIKSSGSMRVKSYFVSYRPAAGRKGLQPKGMETIQKCRTRNEVQYRWMRKIRYIKLQESRIKYQSRKINRADACKTPDEEFLCLVFFTAAGGVRRVEKAETIKKIAPHTAPNCTPRGA